MQVVVLKKFVKWFLSLYTQTPHVIKLYRLRVPVLNKVRVGALHHYWPSDKVPAVFNRFSAASDQ